MYTDILLPVDGSDGARRAAHRAFTLAARHGARVHAVHVVDTSRHGEPARSSTELLVHDLEDAGNDLLDELRPLAAARGVELTTRCCHGDPVDVVLRHAAAVDADLVLVGTTGTGGRRLGRVPDRLSRECESDVLSV